MFSFTLNTTILAVRKADHLNIKVKMFNFAAHILIGWIANTLRAHLEHREREIKREITRHQKGMKGKAKVGDLNINNAMRVLIVIFVPDSWVPKALN